MYINRKTLLPFSYWENSNIYNEFSDLVYIPKSDFVKIPENESLIFKIFTGKKIATSTKNVIVRIGGYHTDDTKIIYAPQWVYDQISNGVTLKDSINLNTSYTSDSSEDSSKSYGLKVHLLQIFNAPIATNIRIKVLNSEKISLIQNCISRSIQDIYEEALSNYGGVEFERIIPLLLKINEDFETDVLVKIIQIEPMTLNGYVRFNGDVVLDFEEPEPLPEKSKELPILQPKDEELSVVKEKELSREELREARLRFFNKT